MSKIDLLNALRLVKDNCDKTRCSQCQILNVCCKYDLTPHAWELDGGKDE